MAISTSKLAPRIIINEQDSLSIEMRKIRNSPVTLMFGFSPVGRTCEMVVCNSVDEIYREFGNPETPPEKYFIDSALKVVQQDATAIMTRLPYDNFQSHNVKYIDFKLADPISMYDIATGPVESITREKDDNGVTVLKEMHDIDPLMSQFQRIYQVEVSDGNRVGSMTNDELADLELDPQANLPEGVFRVIDIRGDQYGTGVSKKEHTGLFIALVSAPTAAYYQGKIQASTEMDQALRMFDIDEGIQMATNWYINSDHLDDNFKYEQQKILDSITQQVNFDTTYNKFHRNESFQDNCTRLFPIINFVQKDKLDKSHLREIGLLVCKLEWDSDQQITKLSIVESYVGPIGRVKGGIDRKINQSSKYIRMYKNLVVDPETDFFVVDNQKLISLGMQASECTKYINYKTSIIDPITFMLESVYSDVDTLQIDTILDAGLSSTAFAAYSTPTQDGETYKTNNKIRVYVDWRGLDFDPDDYIEDYATVWHTITKIFGNFIKEARGDCVYIADGPRILNLVKNYPIRNYTELDNIDLFNKYLPYFNGNTNNYVARYWNWVYIEDLQYANRGLWVPGSVVMGSQLAYNDRAGQLWFAPAGMQRGIVSEAYDASVKTKQYNQENDLLYQNNWNFFQAYQNEGIVVEGEKTLQTKNSSLNRLNVRRLVCYIKQQVRRIGNRYKYEPHTIDVRNNFRSEILSLLNEIQKGIGISDYYVICDTTNNTQETIDKHELWCKIGIKPIKAVEYIIIDLNIINGKITINN